MHQRIGIVTVDSAKYRLITVDILQSIFDLLRICWIFTLSKGLNQTFRQLFVASERIVRVHSIIRKGSLAELNHCCIGRVIERLLYAVNILQPCQIHCLLNRARANTRRPIEFHGIMQTKFISLTEKNWHRCFSGPKNQDINAFRLHLKKCRREVSVCLIMRFGYKLNLRIRFHNFLNALIGTLAKVCCAIAHTNRFCVCIFYNIIGNCFCLNCITGTSQEEVVVVGCRKLIVCAAANAGNAALFNNLLRGKNEA